jgi:hypothetical protein
MQSAAADLEDAAEALALASVKLEAARDGHTGQVRDLLRGAVRVWEEVKG